MALVRLALEARYQTAKENADAARSDAIHEQSRAETQYDTLGLESAFLAEGQARRVTECRADILAFAGLEIRETARIERGALVELEDDSGETFYYFISPCGGGLSIDIDGARVTLLTLQAPLGRALEGKEVDDEVEFSAGGRSRIYSVTSVC